MAQRANAKRKTASKRGGKVVSRGKVATLPKQSKSKKGAKPGMGHNSGASVGISDEMIQHHDKELRKGLRAIAAAQKEVNMERGIYRAARKLAKKEGFDVEAFDLNYDLEQKDLGRVQQKYTNAAHYQRVTDSKLAQLNMFDSLLDAKPKEEPAGVRGYKAGEMGVDRGTNPFDEGSDDWHDWDTQWFQAQKKRAEEMGPGGGRGVAR